MKPKLEVRRWMPRRLTTRRRVLAMATVAGLAPTVKALAAREKDDGGATMAARSENVAMVDSLDVPGARLYYEFSGAEPVAFPGDHVGMATHTRAFVERQDGVFQSS